MIMRSYLNSREVNEMWMEKQQKTQDRLSLTEVGDALTELRIVNSDFTSMVVELEKSDAFQQRLSIINSEVERQLQTGET